MIRRVKGGFKVTSKRGRDMGTYKSHKAAAKRLKQVEYFKRKKK